MVVQTSPEDNNNDPGAWRERRVSFQGEEGDGGEGNQPDDKRERTEDPNFVGSNTCR